MTQSMFTEGDALVTCSAIPFEILGGGGRLETKNKNVRGAFAKKIMYAYSA